MIIAVDVGRSSVKIQTTATAITLQTVTASAISPLTRGSSFLLNLNELNMAKLPGNDLSKPERLFLMGETARVIGEHPLTLTEGETFHSVSLDIILYSVARALYSVSDKEKIPSVSLALDLTFSNYQYKSFYAEKLKGKTFTIDLLDPSDQNFSHFVPITFHIDSLYVLYQGYAAFFDQVIEEGIINDEFDSQEGFVADIGRKTTDMVYIKNMAVKEGDSEAFGVINILKNVKHRLQQMGVVKEIEDIEYFFLHNKKIKKLDGKLVDVAALVKEESKEFYLSFIKRFRSFLEERTPDFFYVVGGGVYYIQDLLKKDYPVVEILKDPVYSNARGLIKFVEAVQEE